MLKRLSIENYALIDSLQINFDRGFTVITGETGAGKSIILGALSLILGQRADLRQVKPEEPKCVIEGLFDISAYRLKPLFDEHEWIYEGDDCILRREIWATGRSRAFINDSPVYLNDLKLLGERLIDIHSQHQNLSLNDNQFQLNVVDLLAGTGKELAGYKEAYAAYRAAEKALQELRERNRRNREEEDYLRFQHHTLTEASLEEGEQERLEEELEALTHSEEIKSGLFEVTNLLSGEQQNVEAMLRMVRDRLQSLKVVFARVGVLSERVESAYFDLKDVGEEASRLFEKVEFDSGRQQVVEERLSILYDLEKKYGVADLGGLLALRDEIDKKLQQIESLDEQLEMQEKEASDRKRIMLEKATQLSEKRRAATPAIEQQLIERLEYLKMPHARFHCQIVSGREPDATGSDDVEFLFSANKNRAPQPVSQIASGGEISRLMLSLKAMIGGATALPTIIFDEIDTGTSGEVADRVGAVMKNMSREMQVIGITHLPQIASKGEAHFAVCKKERGNSVATEIDRLSGEERVGEIARMLSGAEVTEQAVANARVMLKTN
ncbi:MAG TPA: DNA repair protein RecN [Proteiniphilum sp.]|nr:DNA repair protein RecN [Proteiniphilum sp.]HPJ50989.1 DNA repair protein RecN [Proteiniphilum sp.]HPR20625.1 DNA repair protein RecN [Proteiniphilum sp.]